MGLTPQADIDARLTAAGWRRLTDRGRIVTWYRWKPGFVREEVTCVFDQSGRLSTWSVWENRRVSIDGDTGRRDRLNDFIEGGTHVGA